MEYEAMELIEMMYAMVAEAKRMPLAADKCIIERDNMLSMLEELRDSLPGEMEEARRLWEAKDEFIASAKREAEQIRMAAEEQARQIVEQEEIVKLARARADEVVTAASAKQSELFQVVNVRIDQTVAESEVALANALNQVRNLRSALRGVAAPAPITVGTNESKANLAPRGYEVMSADDYED